MEEVRVEKESKVQEENVGVKENKEDVGDMDTVSGDQAHYPEAGGGEMNYTGQPGHRAESRSEQREESRGESRAGLTTLPTRIKHLYSQG